MGMGGLGGGMGGGMMLGGLPVFTPAMMQAALLQVGGGGRAHGFVGVEWSWGGGRLASACSPHTRLLAPHCSPHTLQQQTHTRAHALPPHTPTHWAAGHQPHGSSDDDGWGHGWHAG